jgi:hypothetical protein
MASLLGAKLTDDQMKDLPVDVLAFVIAAQQTSDVDKKMERELTVLKKKQGEIFEMRTKFGDLKQAQKKATKGEEAKMTQEMAHFLKKFDIKAVKSVGESLSKEDWEVQGEYLQAKLQELNSSMENDMLTVQGFMNRRNESLDLASSIIKKSHDAKAALLK